MAVRSGFYNSMAHDRKYNAADMSKLFSGIIKDGIFMTVGTKFETLPASGMAVSVGPGRAWFDNTWTDNDSPILLSIPASDVTLNRIDAVVLEVNRTDEVRANAIKVVKGIPASTPSKPVLTNTDKISYHPLAYVTVPAGAVTVLAENIENRVGTSDAPYITSVLETTSIEQTFNQWEAQFDNWFRNLKNQLDDNQAGNLQNQINEVTSDLADFKVETSHCLDYISPKVGDILHTARVELDDTWLLCNGSVLQSSDFTELTKLLGWVSYLTKPPVSGTIFARCRKEAIGNGYAILEVQWNGVGSPSASVFPYYIRVDDLEKRDFSKAIKLGTTSNLFGKNCNRFNCIFNGQKFIFAGYQNLSGTYYYFKGEFTDPSLPITDTTISGLSEAPPTGYILDDYLIEAENSRIKMAPKDSYSTISYKSFEGNTINTPPRRINGYIYTVSKTSDGFTIVYLLNTLLDTPVEAFRKKLAATETVYSLVKLDSGDFCAISLLGDSKKINVYKNKNISDLFSTTPELIDLSSTITHSMSYSGSGSYMGCEYLIFKSTYQSSYSKTIVLILDKETGKFFTQTGDGVSNTDDYGTYYGVFENNGLLDIYQLMSSYMGKVNLFTIGLNVTDRKVVIPSISVPGAYAYIKSKSKEV